MLYNAPNLVLQVNPEEERLARWTTCQLSGMPLQPPCVADELGSLFNKDAVLQVGLGGPGCQGKPGREVELQLSLEFYCHA